MNKPENYPNNPQSLWNIFYDFTQTPRPSKHEDKIRDYLVTLAKDNDLKHIVDNAGNVVIYVPGKNGRENDAPVLIQNHIDMVTDALPSRKINFKEDPIMTKVVDGWLCADGTTLGADNGIGCAASLAPIFEKDMIHPPLELLFTVDEETGLHGALNLEPQNFTAKRMLNLDTEEWGSLYIGCAGGIDYEFNGEYKTNSANKDKKQVKISVGGFIGGHSGIEIHEQRANAIKILGMVLESFQNEADFSLAEIRGGAAHNIIPRDAFCILEFGDSDIEKLKSHILKITEQVKTYLPKNDQKFSIQVQEIESSKKVLSIEDSSKVINFITLFPHGAYFFDLNSNDKGVSCSNNFARLLLVDGKFYTQSSLRFFDRNEVRELEAKMNSLGKMFDLKVSNMSEYPSWKPVVENSVLDTVANVYKETFNEEAKVTAIHAGLECGILKDKIGEIEVVSFGPTITGAHSPDERVDIASVEKFWTLFKNVLKVI